MAPDYLEDPEAGSGPDESDVHRWEVAQSIIKNLGIQESESDPRAICHGLVDIQEAYERDLHFYVDEHYADASKELQKLVKAAKALRISLALLGDGARIALHSNRRSPERKQAWEQAGGDTLPKRIGPGPDESRFKIWKDHEDIWKEGGPKSKFYIFGPRWYRPSPIELQLKRIEELAEFKVKALREVGKSRKPKRMGDVVDGGHPRHKMIEMCTILLGTHGQEISTKLLPMIRMIEKSMVVSDEESEWKGEEAEWKGNEAAMRAKWWWEEVGAFYGKPIEEVPHDKVERLKKGWTSMPRTKPIK
jgi:hypothetical protein